MWEWSEKAKRISLFRQRPETRGMQAPWVIWEVSVPGRSDDQLCLDLNKIKSCQRSSREEVELELRTVKI